MQVSLRNTSVASVLIYKYIYQFGFRLIRRFAGSILFGGRLSCPAIYMITVDPDRLAQQAKDAARYRWLREQHNSEGRSFHVRTTCNDVPDNLDAAIDAAMAKGE